MARVRIIVTANGSALVAEPSRVFVEKKDKVRVFNFTDEDIIVKVDNPALFGTQVLEAIAPKKKKELEVAGGVSDGHYPYKVVGSSTGLRASVASDPEIIVDN